MTLPVLKQLLLASDPAFWDGLATATAATARFDELSFLSSLRKKAVARGLARPDVQPVPLRLAMLGGCTLFPLHELTVHLLDSAGLQVELFVGDFDNYVAEITEEGSALYEFKPDMVFLLPGAQRFRYTQPLIDSRSTVQAAAEHLAGELLDLCRTVHERAGAEVMLGNFLLPGRHDPGAYRSRTLASDWSFRKWINLELGLNAPSYVRICDLEFIGNRMGALVAEDMRGWFESKQPGSPALIVAVAQEIARLVHGLRSPPKKVLALDLDNTLWGGVVADDGLEGIEIGDTSPRGEAFKAFQRYARALKERGVLLGVVSKNDHAQAMEPFLKHPEMVLRAEDFASFKANWEPKSDNLRRMAAELGLGLDSFVFVDDNPAEIELVRQLAPQVMTILLDPDPSHYVTQLQDCRWFEPHHITHEDLQRSGQYQAEHERRVLRASATDMNAYLESLGMEAIISEFALVDVPRLAQLINKSNQFNLTTRRRTEAEVQSLLADPDYACFSVRLTDRFGDHGLISVVIGRVHNDALEIDTWVMSCRVLKRQVEELVLNELARLARARACRRLTGTYLPTPKNDMVRTLYPGLGFHVISDSPTHSTHQLPLDSFVPRATKIAIVTHAHDPS